MPFRRVLDTEAGPSALGILVPPGRQTLLIVRPRSLPWDLVVVREAFSGDFWQMSPEEASGQALRLFRDLADKKAAVTRWRASDPGLYEIGVNVGAFSLLACVRQPGQPYTPARLPDAETGPAANLLLAVLAPPSDHEQEIYFNTTHFESA
jgi:hypothetical protein